MGLSEREDDVVLGGGGLELEVEAPAETLPEGEPECTVDPAAEGGVDDELHAPRLVEEPFDDEVPRGRHHPERGLSRREVVHELAGRFLREAGLTGRPADRPPDPGREVRRAGDEPADRLAQPRYRPGENVGPGGRLPDPERNGGRLPPGVLDPDPVRLDPEDAP